MTKFFRIQPDDPDVPNAVATAIEHGAGYVGIGRGDERILLASLGLGAAESRIIMAGIIKQVEAGDIWLIYVRRSWDRDAEAYHYRRGVYFIAPSEASMWTIKQQPCEQQSRNSDGTFA